MRVTFKGDKKLVQTFEKALTKFPTETRKVMKNNAEKGKELSVQNAPRQTGFLKDMHTTQYPDKNTALIISGAEYSGYVNYGTRFQDSNPFFDMMWKDTKEIIGKDLIKILRGVLK